MHVSQSKFLSCSLFIIPTDIQYIVAPCALNKLQPADKQFKGFTPVGCNPQLVVTEKIPRRRSSGGGVFGHSLVQRSGRSLGAWRLTLALRQLNFSLCCGFSIIHKPGINVKVLPTKEGQTNKSQHVWLLPMLLSMIISIYISKKYPIALTLPHCLQVLEFGLRTQTFPSSCPRQPDGEPMRTIQVDHPQELHHTNVRHQIYETKLRKKKHRSDAKEWLPKSLYILT